MFKVPLLVLAFFVLGASAQNVKQVKVGGKTTFQVEWRTNPSPAYEMYYFNKGDTVELSWPLGFHDAVVVPDSADVCGTAPSKYIKTLSEAKQGGAANYTIDVTTDFWIICTVPTHCSGKGQKIMFMPTGSTHSNTTSTTPPAPTKPSASGASTAACINTALGAVFGAVMLLVAIY